MDKKILIVDKSTLLRNYLSERLVRSGFEVFLAKDGIDGLIKMRNQLPDLIIMDFYLPRLSGLEFLKEKNELKGTASLPVIMLSSEIDRRSIIKISKYKFFKILSKPIEIDHLFQTIGDFFKIEIEVDTHPCLIDVHLNDDILFIEIAEGFNRDKIEILKYKILEIKELYGVGIQKILIIIPDIGNQENLHKMLNVFLENIIKSTNTLVPNITVLTNAEYIKDFLLKHPKYKSIKITNDFVKAIEYLGKIHLFAEEEEKDTVKRSLISDKISEKKNGDPDQIHMSNKKISRPKDETREERKFNIAVVDDDLSILEFMELILSQTNWNINVYEDGKIFVDELNTIKPDLIFLDLLMPKMSGFDVLEHLNKNNTNIPVIVLTALADKNCIIKARNYGVKSYLTKPVKPQFIKHKAEEILKSNF